MYVPRDNIILASDSYKQTHDPQYPPGSEYVYSYLESRGGKFPTTVFFGLQYYLSRYLTGEVVTHDKLDEATDLMKLHFGSGTVFNRKKWEHIIKEHAGRLPVKIMAVPEGTNVDVSNVLMTVENTDPECFWLTNHLETMLARLWYPITVATQSWYARQVILSYLERNGDPSLINTRLHDFGYRGVSSEESAAIGGAAHLVSFKGTDTIAALQLCDHFYDCPCAGMSVPASEHSTITSWGREGEVNAYRNMLEQYPTGVVSVVSDSYDIYRACSELWGTLLKDEVLARDGTLVVRPDSGDPVQVVCDVLKILGDKFGTTTNGKGYTVLNPKVRILQGDGIDLEMIGKILNRMEVRGWSADNIVFGSGGALLQKLDRDTNQFAFKASHIIIDGVSRDVYKQPATASAKNSKGGRLALCRDANGGWSTLDAAFSEVNELREVFRNGLAHGPMQTLSDIRMRAL